MDIFNETPVEPKFEDIVGEGKKYVDPDAAAKAIVEKDRFIARLQEEARLREQTLREALNTKAFEDRIKALEAAQMAEVREPTPPPASPAPATPTVNIEETVQKAIEQREASVQRSRNLLAVKDKLVETFGNDYPNRVKAKAAELNISMDRLNTLAAETPNAFFALVLGQERTPDPSAAPPASRANTAAFQPQNTRKNNAYFSNMMKTNPAQYFTAATQLEEFSEMKRQGDAFYAP